MYIKSVNDIKVNEKWCIHGAYIPKVNSVVKTGLQMKEWEALQHTVRLVMAAYQSVMTMLYTSVGQLICLCH